MEKSKISISILRVVFVFCLLLFAMSYLHLSFGWFYKSDGVKSGGFSVVADGEKPLNLTLCHVFRYTDNGVVCSELDDTQTYEMLKYDTIFTDNNENTLLFYRIVVEGIANDGNLTVTVPLIDDTDTSSNKFSDVASVKVAFGLKIDDSVLLDEFTPSADTSSSDNLKIFEGVRDLVKISDFENTYYVKNTFVRQNDKAKTLTLTINSENYNNGDESFMCAVKDGVCDYTATEKNALVFYVIFDYESDLIKQSLLDNVFINDIGTITIE